jgi:hypothetical protein
MELVLRCDLIEIVIALPFMTFQTDDSIDPHDKSAGDDEDGLSGSVRRKREAGKTMNLAHGLFF